MCDVVEEPPRAHGPLQLPLLRGGGGEWQEALVVRGRHGPHTLLPRQGGKHWWFGGGTDLTPYYLDREVSTGGSGAALTSHPTTSTGR